MQHMDCNFSPGKNCEIKNIYLKNKIYKLRRNKQLKLTILGRIKVPKIKVSSLILIIET